MSDPNNGVVYYMLTAAQYADVCTLSDLDPLAAYFVQFDGYSGYYFIEASVLEGCSDPDINEDLWIDFETTEFNLSTMPSVIWP